MGRGFFFLFGPRVRWSPGSALGAAGKGTSGDGLTAPAHPPPGPSASSTNPSNRVPLAQTTALYSVVPQVMRSWSPKWTCWVLPSTSPPYCPQQLHQSWTQPSEVMSPSTRCHPGCPWQSLSIPDHCPSIALLPFWFSRFAELGKPTCVMFPGDSRVPDIALLCTSCSWGAGRTLDQLSAMSLGRFPLPSALPAVLWS